VHEHGIARARRIPFQIRNIEARGFHKRGLRHGIPVEAVFAAITMTQDGAWIGEECSIIMRIP
jgi:hypothetical protein